MKKILIYGGGSIISLELIKVLDPITERFYIFCRNRENFIGKINLLNFEIRKFSIFETKLENLENNLEKIKSLDKINGIYWIAGYTGDVSKEIVDEETCKKNISVNFLNPILIINKLIGKLEFNSKPFIAVITSVAGLRGRAKNIFYGSSKAALISYLSGLRQKYNDKINVVTIIPGYIRTTKFNITAPNFLVSSPDKLAKKIIDGVNKEKSIIYCSIQWKIIMLIIKFIPENIFKRLKF